MPRIPDHELTSEDFKKVIQEADTHSQDNMLDLWGSRVVWVALKFNTLGAKRFAERRANYRSSQAWLCYTRLVEAGVFVEEPEGITWTPGAEPWESDPLQWYADLVRIAGGGDVPGLPVNPGRTVARRGNPPLRLVDLD